MAERLDERPFADEEETLRVRHWRRRQFMSLGFGLRDAQRLTAADVDLSDMRRLIASGCPPETARRILQ